MTDLFKDRTEELSRDGRDDHLATRTGLFDVSRNSEKGWEGYTGKDDIIPEQWLGESGFKNYITENPVTREELEKMIEDYYDEWGWDVQTGVPKTEGQP